MNIVKFGSLISFITKIANESLSNGEIEQIKFGVEDCFAITEPNDKVMTATQIRNEVDTLFKSYRQCSKIEAIKAYRTLTGYGLKESKDAVEGLIKDCHNNYSSEGLSKA